MTDDSQWICRQRGFTLVEVMIALLVFMVIAIGVMQGEVAALRAQTQNLLRDEAVRLAEDRLNDLRGNAPTLTAMDWANPPELLNRTLRSGAVTFVRTARIVDANGAATRLTRIEVAVGWDQGSNPPSPDPANWTHLVVLNTIVSSE